MAPPANLRRWGVGRAECARSRGMPPGNLLLQTRLLLCGVTTVQGNGAVGLFHGVRRSAESPREKPHAVERGYVAAVEQSGIRVS